MAVEDKYVDADIVADNPPNAAFNAGALTWSMGGTFEVAAADDDGSVYRVIKNIPFNLIPVSIEVVSDAITAGTDYDIGLYESKHRGLGGTVIDKDIFADGLDLSSATTFAAPQNGLEAVNIADHMKALYEHANETVEVHKLSYDLAFTANTVGSAAGTVSYKIQFVQK